MADNFGLKIGLEGEKEFKKALSEINQSFKVLGSEMKLATSQFDKNDKSVDALAARNKVLRKEIDEQTTKIETLRKALQNAADSFDENDRRTQNWQIQLNNAEATLNDMNRELDENEDAIKKGGEAAEDSGSKFENFGKILKTVGTAMGAVAVAAGAAAVKMGKEVIAAYADYEQLVGGVDTLFKDSSQQLQTYAANAYKTAGLSANEYMETVTGFSASLIQSLGGDTEKAAKYADMAITDMSDNANKMGTDMSSMLHLRQPGAALVRHAVRQTAGGADSLVYRLAQGDRNKNHTGKTSMAEIRNKGALRSAFFHTHFQISKEDNNMKEFWTTIQVVFAGIGGWLGWFLGGCDGLLYALLAFVVIDYVTGIMCAVVDKKLSSEVGFKGIPPPKSTEPTTGTATTNFRNAVPAKHLR